MHGYGKRDEKQNISQYPICQLIPFAGFQEHNSQDDALQSPKQENRIGSIIKTTHLDIGSGVIGKKAKSELIP